jgi:hypothetical protein
LIRGLVLRTQGLTDGNISLLVFIGKEFSVNKTNIIHGSLKEEALKWRRNFSAEGHCLCREKQRKI